MRIIHIVDRFDKVNFGIWNAAIFGSDFLKKEYGIESELWYPATDFEYSLPLLVKQLTASDTPENVSIGLDKTSTIVVTHGCWQFPTKWGHALQAKGFKWIYVPHGMLEPWSMQHKKWKKLLYFHLIENGLQRKASMVRSVGAVEMGNLKKLLNRKIELVENGVSIPQLDFERKTSPVRFLFMARLHHKKGITPLVKAWHQVFKNRTDFQLTIAGPDEGELGLIQFYLNDSIVYVGPQYGDDKIKLLQQTHYYILPSLSEGFPVSVLEAMSYGCIPVITEGCNFPSVFEKKLGFKIANSTEAAISATLQHISTISFDSELGKMNAEFIEQFYSESYIGQQLFQLYNQVLAN